MSDADDKDLIARCLLHEDAAWRELERRHGALLLRAAQARTGNRSQAEEVRQKVLATLAAGGLAAFQGRCSLSTWLMALALNEAANLEKAESRRKDREERHAPSPREVPTPLQALVGAEDRARVREVLDALPPRDRLVLVLLYWDRLPHRDAAGILGVPERAVSVLLQRALSRLREGIGTSL